MAPVARTDRIDLRLSAEQKRLIEQAAVQSGQTISNFVLGATVRVARKVLREASIVELSNRDRDRLLAALDNTNAKPNASLRRAAKRYKAAIG